MPWVRIGRWKKTNREPQWTSAGLHESTEDYGAKRSEKRMGMWNELGVQRALREPSDPNVDELVGLELARRS
jgi:hypothetical protein